MATKLIVMSPRPGRIRKIYELSFCRQFLQGRNAREVKSQPDFIAMREQVLNIIYEDEVDGDR